jgi:CubicO group peptidase (beta-lactamase class C family)
MRKLFFLAGLVFAVSVAAQDRSATLDSLFSDLYKKQQFFGNVLIADKGKIIYQKSFGKANHTTNADLNAESIFELASVSKQFTAMGIMLLKKQGKLSYDDSLRKFIPELPYYKITVRQLLNHTSGLPDYMQLFGLGWDATKIATNKDMIDLLAKHKPAIHFAAGEKWEYSNTGYALLASIIEKASGMDFGAYLDKNIFAPLGMKQTLVFRRRYEKRALPNYAYGYVFDKNKKQFALPDSVSETASLVYCMDGIVGDGTVNSTATDLLKWDRALYTEKLVSKEMMAEAFQPGTLNNGKTTSYGFGWGLATLTDAGKIVNHSGGWPGYATFIERNIDKDKTIIILRNHQLPGEVVTKTRKILYGLKEEVKKEMTVAGDVLKQYAGEYELAPGFTITVAVENDKLVGQATGQEKFEMFAEKENLFFLKVVEAKIEFVKDDKGAVKSLILYQNGQEMPGIRK